MSKKRKYYTLLFVPDDNKRTVSLRIHKHIISSAVIVLALFAVGMILLVLKTGVIAAKLQLVESLRMENMRLNEENEKLMLVSSKISRIEHLSSYLNQLVQSFDGNARHLAALPATGTARQTIFHKDSIDELIDSVRRYKTDIYNDLAGGGESREQLLANIPNILPVEGWITNRFIPYGGPGKNKPHLGIDFAATQGTPVRASAPGIVTDTRNDAYFGLIVTVKHMLGYETRYGHCSQILVAKGNHVRRGQTIALVGNTGRSSGPHLHYELYKDGKAVDPLPYILDSNNWAMQ